MGRTSASGFRGVRAAGRGCCWLSRGRGVPAETRMLRRPAAGEWLWKRSHSFLGEVISSATRGGGVSWRAGPWGIRPWAPSRGRTRHKSFCWPPLEAQAGLDTSDPGGTGQGTGVCDPFHILVRFKPFESDRASVSFPWAL